MCCVMTENIQGLNTIKGKVSYIFLTKVLSFISFNLSQEKKNSLSSTFCDNLKSC